ncbi:MAG: O-antigen ligase family protein [Candidatus Sumerlaeia bacterium]
MADKEKAPQVPEPASGSPVTGRKLSLLFCVFSAIVYLSLWFNASFPVMLGQVFIWGLAWWGRRWPLYAIIFLFPFFGHHAGPDHAVYFVDMTIWLVLMRWLFSRYRARSGPLVYTPINPWLILFFLVSLISFLPHISEQFRHFAWAGAQAHHPLNPANIFQVYQRNPFDSLWPTHALLNLLQSVLFFFCLCDETRLRRHRMAFLLALTSGLGLCLGLGFLSEAGLVDLKWFRQELMHGFKIIRHQSVMGNSGWYAMWLVPIMPFLLAGALYPRTDLKGWRVWLGLLWIGSGMALVITIARGGWAAGLGASLCALGFSLFERLGGAWKRRLTIIGLSFLVLFAALGGGAYIAAQNSQRINIRFQRFFHNSNRFDIWKVSLKAYTQTPILGRGIGYYHMATYELLEEGKGFEDGVAKGTAHNSYVHLLLERGPLGLLAFLGILLTALYRLAKRYPECRKQPDRAWWVAAGLSMLTGWIFYACWQHMLYLRIHELTFWLLLALILAEADLIAANTGSLLLATLDAKNQQKQKILLTSIAERFSQKNDSGNKSLFVLRFLFWLLLPVVAFLILAPLAQIVQAKPLEAHPFFTNAGRPLWHGLVFFLVGFAPYILATGIIRDTWQHPDWKIGVVAFHNILRFAPFAALLLAFAVAVSYTAFPGFDFMGGWRLLALLLSMVLVMNQAILIGRFYASRMPAAQSRRRPQVMMFIFLLTLPVLYMWQILPFLVKVLLCLNPLLPAIRIFQIAFLNPERSFLGWFLVLLIWNSVLAFFPTIQNLRGKMARKSVG